MSSCKSIQEVVRSRLCISCGACVALAPEGSSQLVLDERQGIYLPKVLDEAAFSRDGLPFAACPGKGLPFQALSAALFPQARSVSLDFGRYLRPMRVTAMTRALPAMRPPAASSRTWRPTC